MGLFTFNQSRSRAAVRWNGVLGGGQVNAACQSVADTRHVGQSRTTLRQRLPQLLERGDESRLGQTRTCRLS